MPAQYDPRIDNILHAATERGDIAGVVAIAANAREVIYQGAHGVADLATGAPMTPDAMFRIASMTKAITSTAVMQLVELGKLGVDEPIDKYLPECANPLVIDAFDAATGAYRTRPAVRRITVRHLLSLIHI